MRLGLCCTFSGEPIKFRTTTARYLGGRDRPAQRVFLAELIFHNLCALDAAVAWCAAHGVGAFRIGSSLFPRATHPDVGYGIDELPLAAEVHQALDRVRRRAAANDVRLSFHPDQFVVPGSPTAQVALQSLAEIEHQADIGARIGAVQITIHGGGAKGGKAEALERLGRGLDRLSDRARALVALENDDRVYTVEDLLPLCARENIPLVYDVHHHRCNPDRFDALEATERAAATWGTREPWAHLSTPAQGWGGRDRREHADYIEPRDVPRAWLGRRLTVDVEAKAKEMAVLRLLRWVRAQAARKEPSTHV